MNANTRFYLMFDIVARESWRARTMPTRSPLSSVTQRSPSPRRSPSSSPGPRRAAALAVPSLPHTLWVPTYQIAWAVTAAISGAYRPKTPPPPSPAQPRVVTTEDLADRAAGTEDEHAIKFAEVAIESHRRGNPDALPAGARAAALIAPIDYDQTEA